MKIKKLLSYLTMGILFMGVSFAQGELYGYYCEDNPEDC